MVQFCTCIFVTPCIYINSHFCDNFSKCQPYRNVFRLISGNKSCFKHDYLEKNTVYKSTTTLV